MSVLSISHIDLDGISCQVVLRAQFGEITRMNISYGKIDEYLDILDDYCARSQPEYVFVTDLSFRYEELDKLNKIASKHPNVKFIFIDHHPFEENGGEYKHLALPNLVIILSPKASATKLTFLYLKAKFGLLKEGLEQFVTYVNAYDIWLEDEPEFKVGFVYNELFWNYKINHFWSRFKDEYKLRNSDKDAYRTLVAKKDKLFNKLEKSGRVMKFANRILLIFIDDYQSHVTLDYPDFLTYVVIRSNGGVSVRLRKEAVKEGQTKNNIIEHIIKLDYIDNAGGHPGAFGTQIENATPHKMVEFSQYLVQVIDKELDNINL